MDVALLLIDYDRYSHPELPEQIEVALSQAVVPLAIKVTDHDEVSVQGFPERNVNPDGVALRALIGDVKAPFKQTDCLRLELPSLAASVPELPKGLSGGPVLRSLDGKMVAVGVIRSFPVIHSRSEKLPLGGELLASRIADIAAAIPQVAESLYQCAWLFASARPRRRGRLSQASCFCVPLRRSCSFQGRDAELGALREWCLEADSVSLRLVKGSGGQGKTRLALELVHSMAGDGWAAGFLAPDAAEEPVDLTPIADSGVPVLVVIDYAETRTPQIRRLLPLLWESSDDSPPVRVLLLARSEGEWWERLRTDLDDLLGDVIPLLPLEESPTARIESFGNCRRSLCASIARR